MALSLFRWWKVGLLCALGLMLFLNLVIPLIGKKYPRHVEEKRLANALNEELNKFLEQKKGELGWAHSYWDAGENSATFHVYGAVQEAHQAIVLRWLEDIKAKRQLHLQMEVKFFEDYRRVGPGSAKFLKTVRLFDPGQ